MQALNLGKKGRQGVYPYRYGKNGYTRNYVGPTMLDSFVLYGKDIPEKREKYYLKELKKIERRTCGKN